jgi:hypothetical protein
VSGHVCQEKNKLLLLDSLRAVTYPLRMAKRKNPAAVALGRLGGLKGGPARAKKLTKKQLSESGRKAVQARWAKERERNYT